MTVRAKSGRPGVKGWEAILMYMLVDDMGELSKPKQLLNKDGGIYFENSDKAIERLEDLQIDSVVHFNIFIMLDNETKSLVPQERSRIRYTRASVEDIGYEITDDDINEELPEL